MNEGAILHSNMEKVYQVITQTKIQKQHNLALSTLINKIRIESFKHDLDLKVHMRGGEWIEENRIKIKTVPDWVFETNEAIVFIELDTGSERLKCIIDKIEGYIDFCLSTEKKFSSFFHIGPFAKSELSNNRSGRVASLKSAISSIQNLPSNLFIYTLPSKRTILPVVRILKGIEP